MSNFEAFKKKHIDARIFGGLFTRFPQHDRIASAVTIENAVSLEPVNIVEHALVPSFGRGDTSGEVVGTMGRRSYVEYGVYRANMTYSPHRAKNHFIEAFDLAEFWRGLVHGAEYTRSAARPSIHLRKIVIWVYTKRFPSVTEATLRETLQVSQEGESWAQVFFKTSLGPFDGVSRIEWEDGRLHDGSGQVVPWPTDPNTRWYASAFWEVINSNPNGDPDNGGAPRERTDGRGVISYEAIKRWIREFLAAEGHALAMPRGGDIAAIQDAYVAEEDRKPTKPAKRKPGKGGEAGPPEEQQEEPEAG